MKTATKIALARLAYQMVHTARSLVGKSDRVIVKRRGITYDLDLTEGIDFSIFLLGSFEPSTTAALRRETNPGDTVLDIGANVGAHTVELAQLVGTAGRVLAFEPTEFAFTKLSRNVTLNPEYAKRVTALKMFLGASDIQAVPAAIYSSWPLVAGESELHAEHLGSAQSTAETPARAVDSVLAEHGVERVHLVKMDVDGYECSVLAGARAMMQRDKPVFVMELAPYVLTERGASLDELLGYFLPLGYVFYHEDGRTPIGRDTAQVAHQIPLGASRNVVARVP